MIDAPSLSNGIGHLGTGRGKKQNNMKRGTNGQSVANNFVRGTEYGAEREERSVMMIIIVDQDAEAGPDKITIRLRARRNSIVAYCTDRYGL